MFELKPISVEGIPNAISKAEHYRLLNEPREAESICRDVLHLDKQNQEALVVLLLSLTDQFGKRLNVSIEHAQEVLPRLTDKYERLYYLAIILERWAKAQLDQDAPGYVVYDWFRRAIETFEKAVAMAQTGNDEARLRANACVRIMKRHEEIRPKVENDTTEAEFTDDMPMI